MLNNTGVKIVPRPTKTIGGGPIPGNPHLYPNIVGIILLLVRNYQPIKMNNRYTRTTLTF